MRRLSMALVGLAGITLAGCGGGAAQQSPDAMQSVALSASDTLCGVAAAAGPGAQRISPGIRVSLLSYSALYNESADSSSAAATTIQNGRDALVLGNPAGAETEFQQAVGLLRTARRRVQPLAIPPVYRQTKSDASRACLHYGRAVAEYRGAIASHDTGLIKAGDADLTRANALSRQAERESRPGQHAAGAALDTLMAHAEAGWKTQARRDHLAYTRSQQPVVLAAATNKAPRLTAPHRSVKPLSLTGTVIKILAASLGAHLLYEPNIGTMEHWRSVSTVPWVHYPYAQAVDGLKAILRFPGGGAGTYAAPVAVHRLNYAVQARIRLISYDAADPQKPDQYPTDGFGLFIRSSNPVDLSAHTPGLMGGVVRIAPPQPIDGTGSPPGDFSYAGLTPVSSTLMPYHGYAGFQPSTGVWHTYRIEVRGEHVTLLIDGLEAAQRDTNAAFLGSQVGIFSVGSEIEVSDFKLLEL